MEKSLFEDINEGTINEIKETKKTPKKPKQEFDFSDYTFELAMKEVEEITLKLERGDLSLEDGIKEYKKGVALKEFCQNKLDEAKETMEKIYQESEKVV